MGGGAGLAMGDVALGGDVTLDVTVGGAERGRRGVKFKGGVKREGEEG